MATSTTPTNPSSAKFNDLEVAKVVFDQFFDKLVSALDPVQFSIDLISRGLLASEEAEDLAERNWGRRERMIFLLNRIKGNANPEWFDSLLKILEAADVLKHLEEEMRQCYDSIRQDKLRGNWIPPLNRQTFEEGSKLPSPPGSKGTSVVPVHHPLMNVFYRLCEDIQKIIEENKCPPLEELRKYCLHLFKGHQRLLRKLRRAKSYNDALGIVFGWSDWMNFDNIETIVDYFELDLVEKKIEDYKSKLTPVLTQRLTQINEKIAHLPPDHISKVKLEKMVVRYNLDADGITLGDLFKHRQFLLSRLKIPSNLFSFLEILVGSVVLVFALPEDVVPEVVVRMEEVWRDLWRMRIVSVDVGGNEYDLLKRANREKLLCIRTHETRDKTKLEQLADVVGGTLYEEYGRHLSLQAAVQRYREAGDPQALQKGAVEWLFRHHVPEESRKLLVNPDVVLSRALFLGCCDMYRVQRHLERILPGIGQSLSRWIRFFQQYEYGYEAKQMIDDMPSKWIQLLYNKYSHLESLRSVVGEVEDPLKLSEGYMGKVKKWLKWHLVIEKGNVWKSLFEWGVPADEIDSWRRGIVLRKIGLGMRGGMSFKEWEYTERDKMSLEEVDRKLGPIIFISFLEPFNGEEATEQGRDVFELYFKYLAAQDDPLARMEAKKEVLVGSLHDVYRRDLEESFQLVVGQLGKGGAVAMETSTSSTSHSLKSSDPTSHSPGASDVGMATTNLSEVKRQFQLHLSEVFPLFSKEDKVAQLREMLASLTVHTNSTDLLFKPSEVESARQNLLKYSWWYDCSVLVAVVTALLGREKESELMTFMKDRYTSLSHLPVDEGLSPQPLTDKDVTPPPGYTPLKTYLPLPPARVTMAQVWGLKKTICSALHLQDHALLLKGYMVGSTNVVFYLASSAAVTPKEASHVMMSSDVIMHSMVVGYGTEHEVKYTLSGVLEEMDTSQPVVGVEELNS